MESVSNEQSILNSEQEMLCENCHRKVKISAGRNYKIYYGNEAGLPETQRTNYGRTWITSTTRKYRIAGSKSVFVCHECFYAKTINLFRSNEIALFVVGFLTLCIFIGIIPLILAIREHNKLAELRSAMQRNDQQKMNEMWAKDNVNFQYLPRELVRKQMTGAGQSYTAFLTEGEYAKLTTV